MWLKAVVAGSLALTSPATAQQSAGDGARLRPAYSALLQADAASARTHLQSLDGLSEPAENRRQCILGRLGPGESLPVPGSGASFSDKVLYVYRTYWREAAEASMGRDGAQTRLAQRLAALIQRSEQTEMMEIEARVLEGIRAEGRHGLGGRTGLLRDMMIWSGQEHREVDVALPEGTHRTTLFLLSDFQSRGWANWLTCEASGTGGWAKPEGLYAIVSAWNLESEAFKVSFLAHETQHFADNIAWPGMTGSSLEYRAKLTELALADQTLASLLRTFDLNQGDNKEDAHSYANKRVLAAVRMRLGLPADGDLSAVAPDRLRDAALQELLADTARRRSAGAALPIGH